LSQPGRVEHGEVDSATLVRPLPYRIYLPACAGTLSYENLPTLYLLHGLTYDDSQWDRLGAPALANHMIAEGAASPFLIVMPWERTGIALEPAVVEVLVPYVDAHYPSDPRPASRSIGGLSRGGGWAFRIGLQHPDVFGAIGLHSPALLAPDLFRLPDWLEAAGTHQAPRLWIDIGERDTLRGQALELAATLSGLGVPSDVVLSPGEHNEAYWMAQLPTYLEWYAQGWTTAE
jgi:enterochelin esterase-like enzyme